jgi:Cu(I)/Ag(I) efflux system membrane fusion protein
MKRIAYLTVALSLSLATLAGCKKKQPTPTPRTTPSKARTASPAPKAKTQGHWVVGPYEVVRKALAADDLKAAQQGAQALAQTASKQAGSTKDAAAKGTLQGLSKAATALQQAKDPAAARLAFGTLSQHTITLVTTAKQTKGLTAYQCPMAKGYKKWLQADDNMANPYMGKRMLKCGGKTQMTP